MIELQVLYADAFGISGNWSGENIKGEVTFSLFFSQSFASISLVDFLPVASKSFFFVPRWFFTWVYSTSSVCICFFTTHGHHQEVGLWVWYSTISSAFFHL